MTGDGGLFQQLFYTSCEHGLSGFSGFQFNAVSSGVSAETMHAVETLAGYDPPRSLVESDTPQELARCPVNLCFVPRGRAATSLCVRYAGRDSARRFGNYFAHALHSEDFAAASGGMLGIELWGSPVWTSEVSPDTEIPALGTPPPRGPLTPRAVRAFLNGHPHADQLRQLLAAVLAALAEERSVVVVDSSTDRVAHWFAAVSYLLPPRIARRLSFATYLLRPTRSRLHLIGTVPEAGLDIGPDDQEAYVVFDFAAGRFPDDVPVHYLVHLLIRIGVGSIGSVWSWATEYTDGSERYLGDWHGPVAAAAAAGGIGLTADDVEAVIGWLGGAGHLGPHRAVVARDIYLQHRTLNQRQLVSLSEAAHAGGDLALRQELEGRLHVSRMRAYISAAAGAAEPAPIADPLERERATAQWQRLLNQAEDVRQRVRLMLWAEGAGLAPPAALVRDASRDLADDLLSSTTRHTARPALERETGRLVGCSAAFRSALVAGVTELVQSRGGHHQLFSQFPARLLGERDLEGSPQLLEPYWTAQYEPGTGRPVELMFRILDLRGQDFPDAELLRRLWRQPPWTHREAVETARRLPDGWPGDEALGEWFDRTVRREITTGSELEDCLRLCELLADSDRFPWLRRETTECVATTIELDSLLRSAAEPEPLAGRFADQDTELVAPLRALKRFRLVGSLLRLPVDPSQLPTMMGNLGFSTADSYLRAVHAAATRAGPVGDVLLGHVTGLALVDRENGLPEAHLRVVTAIQRHAAHEWRVEDTERLARAVRPYDAPLAEEFLDAARRRLGTSGRLARLLGRRRTPDRRLDGKR